MKSVIVLTGHRKDRIPDPERLIYWTKFYLGIGDASAVITGMASGFDLWGGKAALDLGIPLICARPWSAHKAIAGDEELYQELLDKAHEVVVVNKTNVYRAWWYESRNRWMVDHGDKLLAAYDDGPGGTKNCLDYAFLKNKNALVINPNDFTVQMRYGMLNIEDVELPK